MKKNLIIAGIVAATVVIGLIAYKPIKQALTERPVEKSIAFSVYRANNYTSDAYNQTSAQVHIIVEKVSKHSRTIVWEKTMDAKLLKQYPSADQAMSQKIIVPGILDKKEHLEVKYVLIYDSKGSQLEMQDGTVVSTGAKSGRLDITI
ncbi:hypothetical protein FRZ67_21035 [Panacibacter ginsenosidivorans]|uniref:Uncharacterized protein n=1 Tax=Panacibacter ginsenosidivorans TaxID=1813871 RepID=A0A5B8VDW3_9BACT|nr:hypothetical protein [Panacibacter ginsenosidivorans]QEC69664.1 hypothetical protein FRZ67_21035 [Panacibacter ginsenosidivorans]